MPKNQQMARRNNLKQKINALINRHYLMKKLYDWFYIYQQLQGDKKINWSIISSYLSVQSAIILIGFSAVNWIFEIFKWKHLYLYTIVTN